MQPVQHWSPTSFALSQLYLPRVIPSLSMDGKILRWEMSFLVLVCRQHLARALCDWASIEGFQDQLIPHTKPEYIQAKSYALIVILLNPIFPRLEKALPTSCAPKDPKHYDPCTPKAQARNSQRSRPEQVF